MSLYDEFKKLKPIYSDDREAVTGLWRENEKLREENARLRAALERYTYCPHVGVACLAECEKIAREALAPAAAAAKSGGNVADKVADK